MERVSLRHTEVSSAALPCTMPEAGLEKAEANEAHAHVFRNISD
jgi:hypothetical protein